ncbi:MAG: hypothetical protein ACP5JG_02285 [Anaerolineae bacterium]
MMTYWLSNTEIDSIVKEKTERRRREPVTLRPQHGLEIHKQALRALSLVIFYMTPWG